MNLCEIPDGVANLQQREMAILVGHFEAPGFNDHGAIALAQAPPLGAGEGQPQCRGIRAGSCHGRAGQEAGERRVVDLAVVLSVVVLLHPSLRRFVEPGQGEIVDTLEHRHQPALDRSPEDLLLAVVILTWLTPINIITWRLRLCGVSPSEPHMRGPCDQYRAT